MVFTGSLYSTFTPLTDSNSTLLQVTVSRLRFTTRTMIPKDSPGAAV